MRHSTIMPPSSLPSLIIPCPVCSDRMLYHACRALSSDLEDSIYACRRCGAEVIRTSPGQAAKAGRVKGVEAA